MRIVKRCLTATASLFIFAVTLFAVTNEQNLRGKFQSAMEFRASEQARKTQLYRGGMDADSAHSWDAEHYNIRMEFFPSTQRVDGTVEITGTCVEAGLTSVPLHFTQGMTVTEVRADGQPAVYAWIGDNLAVALGRICNPGDTFHVSISYNGTPTTTYFYGWALGIYWGNVVYSFTDPEGARNWFPCYDKLFDKATYSAQYTVPEGWVTASNGNLDSTVTNANQTVTTYWTHDYQIETYLISIAISNYAEFSDSYQGIPLEYYVYPQHLAWAQNDFQPVPEMMRCYIDRYGEYPFEKYGMAEAPIFGGGGGMEHQTMTTLGHSMINGVGGGEFIICHELSHMWWGDAVSLIDWPHMWLNEGFATYSEALWVEWRYGMMSMRSYIQNYIQTYYISWEDPNNPSPMNNPPMSILFSPLTYEKGGAVLHMLRYTLGDSLFFESLHQYYNTYRYGYVNSRDFQTVCETVSGQDLGWFFDQWVRDVGYPSFEYFDACREIAMGEYEITLGLMQTQEPPFPVFSTYIDIGVFSGGTWVDTVQVWVDSVLEVFTFNYQGPEPDSVMLDPFGWTLCRKVHRTDINAPDFQLEDYGWSTEFLYPDSTAELTLSFHNAGLPVTRLMGVLSSSDPEVMVSTNLYDFGDVGYQHRFSTASQPTAVSLGAGAEPHWAPFRMSLHWHGGDAVVDFSLPVGAPNLLLVDDDEDSISEAGVEEVLNYLQLVYREWDTALSGLPGGLSDYEAVIWYCGHGTSTLSAAEIDLLTSYLDSGGRLFISGTNIASELQGNSFLQNYLHLEFSQEVVLALVHGVAGDPVGNGYSLFLSSSPLDQDAVTPAGGGITCYNYIGNLPAAVRYEGSYRTVFFGFAFDDIRWDLGTMNTPNEAVAAVLNWLGMTVSPVESVPQPYAPAEFRLVGAHPNPFNQRSLVSFSLELPCDIRLAVYDIAGREAAVLAEGVFPAGAHRAVWDASGTPSGLYFVKLSVGGYSAVEKVVLLK